MAEIVNLRRRRKRGDREQAEEVAAANRIKFGRPKAEKEREAAERLRAESQLAGKKLSD